MIHKPSECLKKAFPGLEWSMGNEDLSLLIITSPNPPSQEELIAALDVADAELSLLDYRGLRAKAYPPFGDQLDMMYHDLLDQTTTWKDAIAAVKALYPKPT
jgi:hypothetical protein